MTKVISAESLSADGHTLASALDSLRHEAGLQPLAPYLAKFFADQVARNLASVPRLLAVVRAVAAVLANKTLNMVRCVAERHRVSIHRRTAAPHWTVGTRRVYLAMRVYSRCALQELYLQQVMPGILTCIVAKKLGGKGDVRATSFFSSQNGVTRSQRWDQRSALTCVCAGPPAPVRRTSTGTCGARRRALWVRCAPGLGSGTRKSTRR